MLLKKYGKILRWVLVIVLVFFAAKGLFSGSKIKTSQVKKLTLENRVVVKTVSASGSVVSKNEAELSFPVTQRITVMAVKKGDVVTAGRLLAQLEKKGVEETTQAAKDTRDIALRQRELFIQNEDANKDLLGGSDAYAIKLREYDESVSNAEATYQAQIASLKSYSMVAPFAGTVVDVTKKLGETAVAGTTIIKIADLNELEFEIAIDQEDYGMLAIGMPTEISLDAFTKQKFSGKITDLPMYADGAGGGAFAAKISIDQLSNVKPLLGMTGDVKITVATTGKEVPSLYYDQVYFDESDKPYIWVVDGDYISKFPIQIGLEGDVYTEIKQNVDKTIVAPLNTDVEVKDGYKAKIVK